MSDSDRGSARACVGAATGHPSHAPEQRELSESGPSPGPGRLGDLNFPTETASRPGPIETTCCADMTSVTPPAASEFPVHRSTGRVIESPRRQRPNHHPAMIRVSPGRAVCPSHADLGARVAGLH